jgi:hypothetical protein
MLLNPQVRQAFDLEREPAPLREAYGDHIAGQSMLLARRLVEAGVPVVTVLCAAGDLTFDRGLSAILQDLHQRGRLDETLVVVMGDFGRTPKINGGAGRDHYPHAFSVMLAGGGVRRGQVYGSSDRHGAFPHDKPCGPEDLHATIFQALGIPRDAILHDRLGRPHQLTHGQPLPLLG